MEASRVHALIAQYLFEEDYVRSLSAFLEETKTAHPGHAINTDGYLARALGNILDGVALRELERPEGAPTFYQLSLPSEPMIDKEANGFPGIHAKNITAVKVSPHDDNVIATGSVDESVALTNLETGEVVDKFWILRGAVIDIDFHPKHRGIIACGCMDGSHHVLDMRRQGSASSIQEFRDHEKYAIAVKFAPSEGAYLCTAGYDKTVRIYKEDESEQLKFVPHKVIYISGVTENLCFSPRGDEFVFGVRGDYRLHYVTTATGAIDLVSMNESDTDTHLSFNCMFVNISPDGRFVLLSTDTPRLLLLPYRTSTHLRIFHSPVPPDASSSGYFSYAFPRTAFDRTLSYIYATNDMDGIDVFNVATQRWCAVLKGHTEKVRAIDFDPRSNKLVSVGFDKTIRVWAASNPEK